MPTASIPLNATPPLTSAVLVTCSGAELEAVDGFRRGSGGQQWTRLLKMGPTILNLIVDSTENAGKESEAKLPELRSDIAQRRLEDFGIGEIAPAPPAQRQEHVPEQDEEL